jgi:hypothetical protein
MRQRRGRLKGDLVNRVAVGMVQKGQKRGGGRGVGTIGGARSGLGGGRARGTALPGQNRGLPGAITQPTVPRPPIPAPQPQQPGAPVPPGSSAPGTAQASLLPDAEYVSNLARDQFDRKQQLEQLRAEGETDQSDTKEAIRRLLQNVERDRSKMTSSSNLAGGLYSGHLTRDLDDYQGQVARQQGDLELDAQRRRDAREAAARAIREGRPLYEAAELAALAARGVDRDSESAAMNMLAPPPPAPAVPARAGTGGGNGQRRAARQQRQQAQARQQQQVRRARRRARRRRD